jgi:cytoskeletal protein CcmA (bactofilin family)
MKSLLRTGVAALCTLALMGSDIGDQPAQAHRRIVVPAGTVHDGWFFGAGDEVLIEGTIEGDAYVAGGRVEVTGTVNGDLLAAGGQVVVTGTVTEDIRAAGGDVRIDGQVEGNVTAAGGSVTVGKSAVIGDNLLAAGGDLRIAGRIERELLAAAGNIVITGAVGRAAQLRADRLAVLPGASIGGDLRATVRDRETTEIAHDAVRGTTEIAIDGARDQSTILGLSPFRFWWKALLTLSLVATRLVLVLLLPHRCADAASLMITGAGSTALWGVAGLLLIPIVVLLLCATLVGIPLGLFLLGLYLWFLYLSQLSLPLLAGHLLRRHSVATRWALFWPAAAGVVAFELLTLIALLGVLLEIAAVLLGLGVLLRLIGTHLRGKRAPGTIPVSPAAVQP